MDGMSNFRSAYELDTSEAEWELRVQLAAAYRLVDHFGFLERRSLSLRLLHLLRPR